MTELQKQQTAETLLNVFHILSNAGEMPAECKPPMIAKREPDSEILARVKRQREIDKSEGVSVWQK